MIGYLFDKFWSTFFSLFGVVTIVFFLFSVLPGDPAQMMMDQNEDSEQLALIKKKFGFDLPVATQYCYFLNDLSPISIHSNNANHFTHYKKSKYGGFTLLSLNRVAVVFKFPYLRTSYQKQGKPISTLIMETLPNTFILAVSSMSIAVSFGILFGIIAMLYKDTWIDTFLQLFSTLGMSIPSFFSAILFSWFFGYVLHEYTHLNMTGSLLELDDFGESQNIILKNLILPAIVLGIRPLAVIIQLMRGSLLEVMSQDYIRTAKSKGLSKYHIIFFHGLKNALNPVVTAVSGWFASLLAGAFFVEFVFNWRGLGLITIEALEKSDLPVLIGSILLTSTLFIVINSFLQNIYRVIDPRIEP